MSPVDSWIMPRSRLEPLRLGALAGPRRAKKDDVQHCGAPPCRRRLAAAAALQLRLLDQVAILMRNQVALDLATVSIVTLTTISRLVPPR